MRPRAGTTLSAVPALATVGVTVVPTSGRPKLVMRQHLMRDLDERVDALLRLEPGVRRPGPCTTTSNVPMPLRPVFSAPPSADGSSTSTAPQASARSSISARDAPEPTSSSALNSSSTPDRSSSDATAWSACTIPPFMSNTPGPVTRPSATVNGRAASAPSGNTVSWWPTSSTFGSPPPDQCTCGPAGLSTRVAGRPSSRSIIAASASADACSASRSSDGDSISTSVRRSASIASIEHPVRGWCSRHPPYWLGCPRSASDLA